MWAPDGEWCAQPVVAENYSGLIRGSYPYGARYVLFTTDTILGSESMWICPRHRDDFLDLNRDGYEVYQIDVQRRAKLLNPPAPKILSFWVKAEVQAIEGTTEATMRSIVKGALNSELKRNTLLHGWSDVEVTDA